VKARGQKLETGLRFLEKQFKLIRCQFHPTATCSRKAFMHADPKWLKSQSSFQYLFALFGSARAKALRKMLMKLTPVE